MRRKGRDCSTVVLKGHSSQLQFFQFVAQSRVVEAKELNGHAVVDLIHIDFSID